MATGGYSESSGSRDGMRFPSSVEFSISHDTEPSQTIETEKPEEPKRVGGPYFSSLKELMYEYNINNLKRFIEQNYNSMKIGNFVRDQLVELLRKFSPAASSYPPNMDPVLLIRILNDFMENQQRKFALFDISFEGSGLLEGSALAAKINSSTKKISELLESLQRRQNEADENVVILQGVIEDNLELIRSYESRIQFLSDKILNMQEKQVEETSLSEAQFVDELRSHLETDLHLNSTFREALAAEQKAKYNLLQEVISLKEEKVYDEADRMKEIAECAKDLELDEEIRKLIIERIQTLTANPQEIEIAVNDWMNAKESLIDQKQSDIDELKVEIKYMDDEIASLKLQHQEVSEEYNRLVSDHNGEIQQKREELETELDRFNEAFGSQMQSGYSLPTTYHDTTSTMQSGMRHPLASTPIVDAPLHSRIGTPVSESTSRPSPRCSGETFSDTSSSLSGSPKIPFVLVTPPSPSRLKPSDPDYESTSESRFSTAAPGTVTLPQPSSVFSSELPPFCSTAENISQVTNRIHIGKSFQMRTIQQGSLSPYKQDTRVESIIPRTEESNRLVDTPLSVTHRAEFTPNQFVTPFISKSRFGYTDPTAKVLNIPPGDDLDIPTRFKKSVLLTSPRRNEPLRADIVVHPKAITQTSSGENLTCDITVSLQEQPGISPVLTYGHPPAVTPTTTRRHGLFTPKGIFQKKHFNVRRIYRPEEYYSPDLPWSPHDIPQDSRSPLSPLLPSPKFTDKSISWEKKTGSPYASVMNRTFEAPPAMNRTFEAPPAMNRTFEASPTMNTTFEAIPAMNRTFDATSPTVMNKTFDASSPRLLNTTFEQLRPSAVNRTFEKSPSPTRLDSTFERSRSPALNQTFNASQSPPLDAIFDKNQSSPKNRTFDQSKLFPSNIILNRSLSPSPERISDRTTSSVYDDSYFDSSLYDQNMSTQSLGTYNLGYSPRVEGISRRRQPPQFHTTF